MFCDLAIGGEFLDNVMNCDAITKKVSVTTAKGTCVRGDKPQTYEARIKGRWQKRSAELWLRRELMDPSITITDVSVTAHTYSIPSDIFFDNAEVVK